MLPSISIVIPTYNSEGTIVQCLKSIVKQDYPREKIEIIIVDGGSKDKTLEVARKYKVDEILHNPLRTGEAGKAVGVEAAQNEVIALIDSDNVLDELNWLRIMVEPFNNKNVVGSEPIYYTYKKENSLITRYCSLLGMNDPLCLYLGNYDRYCYIMDKWTDLPVKTTEHGNYLLLELDEKTIPTMGANGFLVRTKALRKVNYKPYLFDIDVVYQLVRSKQNKFVKVKIGITHLFSNNVKNFIKKTYRRIRDYSYYERRLIRKYPWKKINKIKILKFVLYTLLMLPIAKDLIGGYRKIPDKAWLFHLPACQLTLFIYGISFAYNLVK